MQLIHIYYMGSKTGSQNSFLCRFNRWNIASMFFTGDCGNDLHISVKAHKGNTHDKRTNDHLASILLSVIF